MDGATKMGQYNNPHWIAKTMDCYCFKDSGFKIKKDLKEYIKNVPKGAIYIPISLWFGDIIAEYRIDMTNKKPKICYYCRVRYDFSEVTEDCEGACYEDFDMIDEPVTKRFNRLEEHMYTSLMCFAEKHELLWNR